MPCKEFFKSTLKSTFQAEGIGPARLSHESQVSELPRRSIGFAGVGEDFALVADGFCDELGEVEDGDVFAGADVDPVGGILEPEKMDQGVG